MFSFFSQPYCIFHITTRYYKIPSSPLNMLLPCLSASPHWKTPPHGTCNLIWKWIDSCDIHMWKHFKKHVNICVLHTFLEGIWNIFMVINCDNPWFRFEEHVHPIWIFCKGTTEKHIVISTQLCAFLFINPILFWTWNMLKLGRMSILDPGSFWGINETLHKLHPKLVAYCYLL